MVKQAMRMMMRSCTVSGLGVCGYLIYLFLHIAPPVRAEVMISSLPIWQQPGSYPTGAGWADFDGNGWHDLVVTQGLDITNSPNLIYFNDNGIIDPIPGWSSNDLNASNCVFIGDFDSDGDPDLSVANLGLASQGLAPVPHTVYMNEGGLSLSPDWLSPPGNAFSCSGGDPDGDGDLDLVFPQGHWLAGGEQRVCMYGNTNGDFGSTPAWTSDVDKYACEAVFGDVDNDGDLDLAVGWGDSTGISIFFNNNGSLETSPSWSTSEITSGLQMAFCDIDDDDDLDLAVADPERGFMVFENHDGIYNQVPEWIVYSGNNASAVSWADVDWDGDKDLAVGSWSGGMGIFENIDGILAREFVWASQSSAVQQIIWDDFDEDGLLDTTETITCFDNRRLFYLAFAPVHEIHSVMRNENVLSLNEYCYDPYEGWISLGQAIQTGDIISVEYTYSRDLDFVVTDWSEARIFENRRPIPPFVLPDFSMDTHTGQAPVTIQFYDESYTDPPASSWTWDFNGDGVIDATEQNPEWTFDSPGSYSVALMVSNNGAQGDTVHEDCVFVFNGESAVDFNGESGIIRCPSSQSLEITEILTCEAWINPRGWGEVQSTGYGRILDKSSFALYLHGEGPSYNDHSLMVLLRNTSGPPSLSYTPVGSIELDTWQHVAMTYDANTSELQVYINGIEQELEQTREPSGALRDHDESDLILGNGPEQNLTFDGVIDELRIWYRVRTQEEIQEYADTYLTGTEGGLAGYWKLNEGSGCEIFDETANSNNGTGENIDWHFGVLDPTNPAYPEPEQDEKPCRLRISGCSPNPFSRQTSLELHASKAGYVSVGIYDLRGHLVHSLIHGDVPEGCQTIQWNGTDMNGQPVASGVYFCCLEYSNSIDRLPIVKLD